MQERLSDEHLSRFREYLREKDCSTLQVMALLNEGATHHIAKLIHWCVTRRPEYEQFWKAAQQRATQEQEEAQKTIEALRLAASASKRMRSADHFPIMLMPLPANVDERIRLPIVLETEASRLEAQLDKIEPRRRMKRLGDKSNIYLYSVQAFVQHWTGGERRLSDSELADLLEAGQYAVGLEIDIDSENLGKRLRRFANHPENVHMCRTLHMRQQDKCDSLRAGNPVETAL